MRTADDPTGKFLNGQVSGLGYDSYTWRGGTTDQNGDFTYRPGEEVTFSVGGVTLDSAEGQENITPIDLAPEKADGIDPAAINMTRFLMSIDLDGNAGNGIVISEGTSQALADASLDFSSPDFDAQATAVMESLSADQVFPEEETPRGLVSPEDAGAYLSNAVADIEAEEQAAAEEEARFECSILKPEMNALLIQGETVTLNGYAKGGSGSYTYQWTLGGDAISSSLNPGLAFSALSPGTYELTFTVKDSDGALCSDTRLVTVLDKSAYSPIPTADEIMQTLLDYQGSPANPIVRVGEAFPLKVSILNGNPPFFYSWTYPSGVSFRYGETPLDAAFTFPSQGIFHVTIYFRDTRFGIYGPDTWYQSVNVTVVP